MCTVETPNHPSPRPMAFPEGLSPAQLLYPDLDAELASTRKILALVPEATTAFGHTRSQ